MRENATVYLFSDFPCEQAEVHQENYLKENGADVPAMHIDRMNNEMLCNY